MLITVRRTRFHLLLFAWLIDLVDLIHWLWLDDGVPIDGVLLVIYMYMYLGTE